MSDNLRTAVKGVKTVLILSLLGMIVGYLLRLYLARSLSVAEFGLLYAIFSFTSIFVIFRDFGLSTTTSKFVSEFLAKGEHSKIKSTVTSSIMIQLLLGTAIASVIIIFSEFIAVNYFSTTAAILPLQLMMISFVISIVIIVFQNTAQGYGKMQLYASVEFFRISLVFIFAFFLISLGVTGVAISYLLSSIVLATIYLFLLVKKFGFFKYKRTEESDFMKKLFSFSIPLFVGSLGGVFLSYADTIILTAFRSLEEVGLYNVALPTAQIMTMFSSISSAVLLPFVSRFWSEKNPEKISKGLKVLVRFILIVVLPLVGGIIIFSDVAIGTLFGTAYLGATQTLRLLEISIVFSILYSLLGITIIGIGKPFVYTKIHIVISIVSVVSNIILVPHIGILGAAITSILVYILGFIITLYYVNKHVPIHIEKNNTVKIIFSNFFVAFFVYSLRIMFEISTLVAAIAAFACGIALYIALIAILKIFSPEDENVISSFGVKIPNFAKKLLFGE